MIILAFGMILAVMLVLPLYFIDGRLLPAALVGLCLLPCGIANGLFSAVAGRLFDSFGAKWLVKIGALLAVLAMTFLVFATATTAIAAIIIATVVFMIGIPLIFSPAQTNALNQLPPEISPDGTAVLNTMQQIGGAITIALTMVFLTAGKNVYTTSGGANTALEMINGAHHYVFIFSLIIAIV